MKMSELSARAKIPAATIRNYARTELFLGRPKQEDHGLVYCRACRRLGKIQAMQKKGHSLDENKKIIGRNLANIRSNPKLDTVYTSKRKLSSKLHRSIP